MNMGITLAITPRLWTLTLAIHTNAFTRQQGRARVNETVHDRGQSSNRVWMSGEVELSRLSLPEFVGRRLDRGPEFHSHSPDRLCEVCETGDMRHEVGC